MNDVAILNSFTGQLLDRDNLPDLKQALEEIEAYIRKFYDSNRGVYMSRDVIRARIAELDPITLPRRSRQTDKQRRVDICPRCKSEIVSETVTGEGAA